MKKFLGIAVSFLPLTASAVTASNYSGSTGFAGLIVWFAGLLNTAVPIIISLAVVFFIWNVFSYAVAGDEDKKKQAKTQIIWGVVGIFVMVSIWGLVAILSNTFSLDRGAVSTPILPL